MENNLIILNEEDITSESENYIKLSNRAEEVDVIKKDNNIMREVILKIKDTMRENDLKYLSAPQIGYDKRIICLKFGKDEPKSFINPIITKAEGLTVSREKSPSIANKEYLRIRNNAITVCYQNPLGKILTQKFVGMSACVFQQMIDNLDGLLLCDNGLEIDELWDNATEDERAEVIKEYMSSLDIAEKKIKEEINSDEELKEISDGIRFMEEVNSGKTKIEGYKFKEEEIA